MSRYPTVHFQVTRVRKETLTKHIVLKFPLNLFWKRRVYIRHTFTLIMKPVFPVAIFEMMIALK